MYGTLEKEIRLVHRGEEGEIMQQLAARVGESRGYK